MARTSNLHFGTLLLAIAIALVLWGMAHGASQTERSFDLPVVLQGIPDNLVITDQSADVVNVRLRGTRAALRNISPNNLEYPISVSGSKEGLTVHEVDTTFIDFPRGVNVVSRSPALLEVKFERAGRRSVKVRPDLEGTPSSRFEIVQVTVDPPRVWLAGARGDVLRLSEVVTETIEVGELVETTEREVRLSLGGGHVWMEESRPVTVRIEIKAVPEDEPDEQVGRELSG